MSFLYFGNTPASVPPILDTSPCMKEMLTYEDCVFEYSLCFIQCTCPPNVSHSSQLAYHVAPTLDWRKIARTQARGHDFPIARRLHAHEAIDKEEQAIFVVMRGGKICV